MPVNGYLSEKVVSARFDGGQKIIMDDGHLRVSDGSPAIALYARGSWHHAEVILPTEAQGLPGAAASSSGSLSCARSTASKSGHTAGVSRGRRRASRLPEDEPHPAETISCS